MNNTEDYDYELFKDRLRVFAIPTAKLQRIVGFYSQFASNDMSFKVKYMNIRNSKGEKCTSAGKAKIIDIMNMFDGTTDEPAPYNTENTKDISATGLCVVLEIAAQEKTRMDPQKRIWFVTAEQSAFNKLPELNI